MTNQSTVSWSLCQTSLDHNTSADLHSRMRPDLLHQDVTVFLDRLLSVTNLYFAVTHIME